ncbi:nicotinamide riboside transporter PnuC [Bacteroidota bacterium]
MQELLFWAKSNYIEILGAVSALIYLYFSIKQNVLLWPLGIITSVLYVYVFFNSGFYADMGLNVYYVIISIYGWYYWTKGRGETQNKKKNLPVVSLNRKLSIKLCIIGLLIFVIIAYVLVKFTDSQVPYWDAFTTAGSIIATWMLARKIIEHWLIWVVVDLVSLALYIYKDLYATSVLFIVYTTMAVVGYVTWKKDLK